MSSEISRTPDDKLHRYLQRIQKLVGNRSKSPVSLIKSRTKSPIHMKTSNLDNYVKYQISIKQIIYFISFQRINLLKQSFKLIKSVTSSQIWLEQSKKNIIDNQEAYLSQKFRQPHIFKSNIIQRQENNIDKTPQNRKHFYSQIYAQTMQRNSIRIPLKENGNKIVHKSSLQIQNVQYSVKIIKERQNGTKITKQRQNDTKIIKERQEKFNLQQKYRLGSIILQKIIQKMKIIKLQMSLHLILSTSYQSIICQIQQKTIRIQQQKRMQQQKIIRTQQQKQYEQNENKRQMHKYVQKIQTLQSQIKQIQYQKQQNHQQFSKQLVHMKNKYQIVVLQLQQNLKQQYQKQQFLYLRIKQLENKQQQRLTIQPAIQINNQIQHEIQNKNIKLMLPFMLRSIIYSKLSLIFLFFQSSAKENHKNNLYKCLQLPKNTKIIISIVQKQFIKMKRLFLQKLKYEQKYKVTINYHHNTKSILPKTLRSLAKLVLYRSFQQIKMQSQNLIANKQQISKQGIRNRHKSLSYKSIQSYKQTAQSQLSRNDNFSEFANKINKAFQLRQTLKSIYVYAFQKIDCANLMYLTITNSFNKIYLCQLRQAFQYILNYQNEKQNNQNQKQSNYKQKQNNYKQKQKIYKQKQNNQKLKQQTVVINSIQQVPNKKDIVIPDKLLNCFIKIEKMILFFKIQAYTQLKVNSYKLARKQNQSIVSQALLRKQTIEFLNQRNRTQQKTLQSWNRTKQMLQQ